MAVSLKITVFWELRSYNLIGSNLLPPFSGYKSNLYPEDGVISFLRNVDTYLPTKLIVILTS
jgi:hypothetical protein